MPSPSPDLSRSGSFQSLPVPQVPSPPSSAVALTPTLAPTVSPLSLEVNVIRGQDLAPKDRNGTSDPYLVLTLGDAREATSMIPRTLNPQWNQTLRLPIVGPQSRVLEAVCWDKDRFGKDYMGEFNLNLEDLPTLGNRLDEPMVFPLRSRRTGRKDSHVTGSIVLECKVVDPENPTATKDQIFSNLKSLLTPGPAEIMGERFDSETDSEGKQTPSSSRLSLLIPRIRSKPKPTTTYALSGDMASNLGVLFLEVVRITDLPPERNVTRTGFDMDPFVVISLGKKTYRTRVIRHDLNPVFNEKFYFTVPPGYANFSICFEVIDKDKVSNNDYVGNASLPLAELLKLAPVPDPVTGLYPIPTPDVEPVEADSSLLQEPKKPRFWSLSRSPSAQNLSKLTSNAASNDQQPSTPQLGPVSSSLYTTTAAVVTLPENEEAPSKVEMVTSDCPSSYTQDSTDPTVFTLRLDLKNKSRWEHKHQSNLYVRAKYVPYKALRQQFWRAMLKQYDADESGCMDKVELTTMLDSLGSTLFESTVQGFFKRFAEENGGDDSFLTFDQAIRCLEDQIQASGPKPGTPPGRGRDLDRSSPDDESENGLESSKAMHSFPADQPSLDVPSGDVSDSSPNATQESLPKKDEEHVIEIKECPICHQPRLNKRSESDILVHIAICANQDWGMLNTAFSSYVTSSQAQRKWFSKVLKNLSYGQYSVGANSANILVQDRLTGKIIEERMSSYVRLFIRILYKGTKNREMEAKSMRKLLKYLTIKQGKKFDLPISASEIGNFIRFHNLDMSEVLLPISDFKSFNEFFYRKLKPGARPCCEPDRPEIVVSAADCRCVVFDSITQAQQFWVKGREFTIARLFGDAYPEDVSRYVNGSMAIFRLAPQDYHRFHIPVDGKMGEPRTIEGEYYTVNPMAIRSALDVYGENVRVLVPIDSTHHGRVMIVCVGAMMVGSTVITRQTGSMVSRGDELGYFKFGGSTLLVLFEPGRVIWDDDLLENSKVALEMLIRVGMSIGRTPGTEPAKPVYLQVPPPA